MQTEQVYYKDARQMAEVDNNSVTVIITSPPYFNVKDYSKDGYQQTTTSESVPGQIGDIQDFDQ